MKDYIFTLIGSVVSLGLWLSTLAFDLTYLDGVLELFGGHDNLKIDELALSLIILVLFLALDLFHRRRSRVVRVENLKIYKAMLTSTQHILNNFLNQMQLFKMTAESTEGFPEEVLQLYDDIMDDALAQIDQLSNVASIDEKTIVDSVAPQIDVFPDGFK
ncbi:MAG: hypothetical protein AAF708_02795 [Deinococcota bacterium]